jgi:hypothetical protein
VNVLSGETAHTQQSGYVVGRREKLDIRGWRKSMGEIAAFYFTSLGDSYAARTGRPDNVGVIGVALYKRKPSYVPPIAMQAAPEPYSNAERKREMQDAPASAPSESSAAGRLNTNPSSPLGTGHGRREESQVRYVNFERATSAPIETILIHYDSYPNLVARGIIISERTPQAFPGFVADPPASGFF